MMSMVEKINSEVWATLAPSEIHGVGVFAIRDIPKGTELFKRYTEWGAYNEVTDEEFMSLLEPIRNMILDRTQQNEGEKIRFRHPNCVVRLQSFMNHADNPNTNGQLALVDILKGEELTENFIKIASKKLHRFIVERYKHEGII